jgi:hypothetical protein
LKQKYLEFYPGKFPVISSLVCQAERMNFTVIINSAFQIVFISQKNQGFVDYVPGVFGR